MKSLNHALKLIKEEVLKHDAVKNTSVLIKEVVGNWIFYQQIICLFKANKLKIISFTLVRDAVSFVIKISVLISDHFCTKCNFSPYNITKQFILAETIIIDLAESSFYWFNFSCLIPSVERRSYCSIQAQSISSSFRTISTYLMFAKERKIEAFRKVSPYEGVC